MTNNSTNFASKIVRGVVTSALLMIGGAASAEYTFHFEVKGVDHYLPPPAPTLADCYDPANVGTIGEAFICEGLLIVEDGTGPFGIRTAVDSGIWVDGVQYGATDIFTGQVTMMNNLFMNKGSFNADIGYWDTSNVTTMSAMFKYAYAFNQDISGWDVSKVTTTYEMFRDAAAFNQNLSSWNTSNLASTAFMFRGATSFNGDISSWDVSNVTDFTQMFFMASAFNQPIGSWDTSSAASMSHMFHSASSFNQDIGGWITNGVGNMLGMFQSASNFNQDLTRWCTTSLYISPPTDFSSGSALQAANEPVWGTCP